MPLALAAAGIVLRGCGFVFREATQALTGRRLFGAVFALSSVVTPFFLGAVLRRDRLGPGARRRPRRRSALELARPDVDPRRCCSRCSCAAFLAAVFLVFDARRMLDEALERYFRRRAIGSGRRHGRAGASAGCSCVRSDAPYLYHGLLHDGLPLVILSGALRRRRHRPAGRQRIVRGTRALAVGAVVAMLAAWGVAQ